MKILALTSIRSEYDLLSSLFFKLQNDPEIELKLIVGGAHNSATFGNTYKDIEKDDFDILCRVESLLDADSPSSRLKSASILLISIIDAVRSYAPDVLIYAGDREEVLIGAMLGGYLGIPTIHFFGGDHTTDGHIDNPVRHAASKLSSWHMVSTQEHYERLRAIGEPENRIFNIGSIALDKFIENIETEDIAQVVSGYYIKKPLALFIYHPIQHEVGLESIVIDSAINSLNDAGYHVFIGLPNSDPGNNEIRKAIKKAGENNANCTVYGNLPRDQFISLFKSCSIIVGNSSAGILEAASIPIPCVNIGERQRGRYAADNVFFVDAEPKAIKAGIELATNRDFINKLYEIENPYGDGKSSQRAYELIKTLDLKRYISKKEDPLNDHG
jgi:GDP/UDP-N,N'-diacetylbacillosamine 2-epimerase (hydrolysing)